MRKHFHILLTGLAVCLGLFVLCVSALHAEASTYEDDISYMSFTYTDLRTGQKETFSLPNGKPTVVIYGGVGSCGNTNNFIYNVCRGWYDFSDFELYVFDIKDNTAETILGQMEGVDSRVHVASEGSCMGSNLYGYLWKYIKGYTMPFVAFIDADGILREFSEAYSPLSDIDVHMRSIGVPSTFVDPVFDLPLEVKYCQTEARTEFEMINAFRTGDNAWVWNEDDSEKIWYTDLEPLTYDYELEKVAMKRAAEIALYYSHYREDDKSCFDTYTDLGYSLYGAGENIAAGYTTARTVFTAWQEEDEPYDGQGHRRNILDSDYVSVGVGCVYYAGYYYWVQEFSSVNAGPESTEPAENSEVVTVKASYDYMEKMALDKDAIQMEVSQRGPITDYVKVYIINRYYSFYPQHYSRPTMLALPFRSSNEKVVRYKNGEIIAYGPGTAELTAELYNGAFIFKLTVTVTGDPPEDPDDPEESSVTRIFGSTRYQTSLKAALKLKELLGVEKFRSVVLTTGENFADALSGSYLANLNGAPVLLIKGSSKVRSDVQNFIKENVYSGGIVYILGGTQAVPDEWLGDLASSYDVRRIAGSTRYLTNLKILNESGFTGGDILVCTGTSFADSLSASAVPIPILLVNGSKSLNKDQKQYLASFNKNLTFIIIGGPSAVSASFENELARYGTVKTRIAGNNRYQTSTMIAQYFFPSAEHAVLAYGQNYPDGLSGGALACALNCPLILADSTNARSKNAVSYCSGRNITDGLVLGGSKLITDDYVRKIFSMSTDAVILTQ